MLGTSSPPNVSLSRQGPRSSATTRTPCSVSTLAAAAPEAPAPITQTSVRDGFVLSVTIGLPILFRLAFREPWQRAEVPGMDFHQRLRPGETDEVPSDPALVAAVDRIAIESLPRVH